MAFNWRKFPWTNLHDLNLDWIIQTVKTLENNLAAAGSTFREMIDTAVGPVRTALATETENRKSGDAAIQTTIENEIKPELATETENRKSGDAAIQTAIENEIKPELATETENRKSGDAALQSTIDNVIIPRLSKIPTKTSELINDSGFGTYSKPAEGIPESDLTFDVRTKLNSREKNIITIETENVDPLNPYKSSKTLTAIKNDFTHNIEQFVFYDNISYKLEKIITDNGVEKAVFYSTSRLVNNVLTYYTCEIYAGNFGYSAADFHTYTYTVTGGAVESVNGKTGTVVLNAEDVGAQRTLIAGSGITIVESEAGDIIQSDAAGGSGTVSFVDVAGGAPIAEFTLNQMQDYEINVNTLTARLSTKVNNLEVSLSNNYRTAADQDAIDATKQSIITDLETIRSGAAKGATALQSVPATYRTAAEQDVIDNTKITDAPVDGKEYTRKNGNWHEITGSVESVNGKTGVVTLNATEIASTKLAPTNTISFLIDGSFDEALVELKLNGANASANDFMSAINSGSTVTVGLNDQGNPKVTFKDTPVKYKITNDTLSLCFIAETGHTYTPAIYVLSGPTSGAVVSNLVEHRFTDSLYQEHYVSANDLPVSAPMTVEEYLEALEARIAALEAK